MKDLDQKIEEAKSSWSRTFDYMDVSTFIDSWDQIDPPIAPKWTPWTLKMIDDCSSSNLTKKELALLYPTIFELRWNMYSELWSAQYADASVEERMKIFTFFDEMLRAVCIEDFYAFKKSVIHTQEEVLEMTNGLLEADTEIAKKLGRTVNACYHLSHALFSDMHPSIVYDVYGPYDVSDKYGEGAILVVKSFRNLNPVELWPETESLNQNRIDMVTVYKNVQMTSDAVTHVIYKGNLIENLLHYSLSINGKTFHIEDLDKVSGEIENMAAKIYKLFIGMDLESKKRKYYHMRAYAFKGIREKLGQDWKPTDEILKEAEGRPLHKPNYPKNYTKALEDMVDPRVLYKV